MNSVSYLQPDFDCMPAALCSAARWVVWKEDKVPYRPTNINRKASSTAPDTWGTFNQAKAAYKAGGCFGVGFVLSAEDDGIVGVDLDKCVIDNVPEPAALELMQRIGCEYIELSPSGKGLRGFGYGAPIQGTRGRIDNVNVELYACERYLTVTGRAIRPGQLVTLPGFEEVASYIRGGNIQKRQKVQKLQNQSSTSSASSVSGLPVNAVPTQPGMRNRCIFELARYLKGTRPDATRIELRPVVAEWHQQYLPFIDTKDFSVTWIDFLNAWEKVEKPYGGELKAALALIDPQSPLPDAIQAMEYGDKGNELVRICIALQRRSGSDPFFIGARLAGELICTNHTDASKMLSLFVKDGVLTLVSKGGGFVASRYRFVETP